MKKHDKISCSELEKKLTRQLEKIVKIEDANSHQFLSLKDEVDTIYNLLYNNSQQQKYYWVFCSFGTYQSVKELRKQEYQNKYSDSSESEFWESELKIVTSGIHNSLRTLSFHNIPIQEYVSEDTYVKTIYSQRRKYEIISQMIDDLRGNIKSNEVKREMFELQPEAAKNTVFKIGEEKYQLADRYYILNKILELSDTIAQLDVQVKNKHQLLAMLLNCNIDNAKHLINATYPPQYNMTQERKDELSKFIKKYKSQ